jgi:predicted small lipoprotein YifL
MKLAYRGPMKLALVCLSVALALQGCGRNDPSAGEPQAKAPIDETRQAEKASDAGKPLTDASLTQIIRAALESESSLDARKIDVENRSGKVALHGSVASEEQREKAARIVSAVGGVRDVQNNLAVDPSATTGATGAPPGAAAGAAATIPQRKD